jgi:hypothetical protein
MKASELLFSFNNYVVSYSLLWTISWFEPSGSVPLFALNHYFLWTINVMCNNIYVSYVFFTFCLDGCKHGRFRKKGSSLYYFYLNYLNYHIMLQFLKIWAVCTMSDICRKVNTEIKMHQKLDINRLWGASIVQDIFIRYFGWALMFLWHFMIYWSLHMIWNPLTMLHQ